MSRRDTVSVKAAGEVISAAASIAGTDDCRQVLALLVLAEAMVIVMAHDRPEDAIASATSSGPALAEMVEQVGKLRLSNAAPAGSA
jgi:hypothetical protein